ncbi:unnamed protein product [Ectocarpus sp. 4 AP-2014]
MLLVGLSSAPPLCSLSAGLSTPPSGCCGNVKQQRRSLSWDVRSPPPPAGAMADDGVGSTAELPAVSGGVSRGDGCGGGGGGGYGGGRGEQAAGFPGTTHRLHDRTSAHPTTAPFDNRPEVGNRPCSTLRYNRRRHPRTRTMSTPSPPRLSTRCSTGRIRSSAHRRRRHARGSHRHDHRTRRRAHRPRP